jgi:hypothetical protein
MDPFMSQNYRSKVLSEHPVLCDFKCNENKPIGLNSFLTNNSLLNNGVS